MMPIPGLTNGRGRMILSWAQIIWALSASFGLGMIWNDLQRIKSAFKEGIYSKQESDKQQALNREVDGFLYSEILRVEAQTKLRGNQNGVRIQTAQ
jgi:hypothetical protein